MDKGRARWLWLACAALAASAACKTTANDDNAAAGTGLPIAGQTAGTTAGMMPTAGTLATGGTTDTGTGGIAGASTGGASGVGGMMTGTGGIAGTMAGMGGTTPVTDASTMMDSGTNLSMLPPTDDYSADGPFETTMESSTGPGGGYTIFRPDPLGTDGFVHAPIIFGPGILTTPSSYAALLNHLASHGFVTIVVNSLSGGPGNQANVDKMEEGLDWLIAQNTEAGVYEGMLAVDRAITMGYSLGATASVQLSSHAAVMSTVSIHGHNTSGDPHGPVLLLTGTDDVIDDVRDTLTTLEESPAVLMALPIGHLTVLTELSATGRYFAPITAWLRYWVNGDENAKSFFWGADCEMCSSPWITPEPNALWEAQML